MAKILNIDSSTKLASVSLAEDGNILLSKFNGNQKDHSAFLHPAIKDVMAELGVRFDQLAAISVTGGPGSYTGLRVGLSTAKGLCYAKNLPLILVGTLPCIAHAAALLEKDEEAWYTAMVDARRMEVFTATYNYQLEEILAPSAQILGADSFTNFPNKKIIFSGDGSAKFQKTTTIHGSKFYPEIDVTQSLAQLSFQYCTQKKFSSIAYSEPFYLKEFQGR